MGAAGQHRAPRRRHRGPGRRRLARRWVCCSRGRRFRYRALLRVALAAPVLLPPYVVALAWTYLGGSRGLLAAVAGYDALAAWTYSLPAAVLVLGLVLYPLSMLATEVALRRIDGRLEEAALMVAAPRARVLAHHGAPRGARASWPPRW